MDKKERKRGKVPVLYIHSTPNEDSDTVRGSHLLLWHGCVAAFYACRHVMCLSPAAVLTDEEVSHSKPVQLLATAHSHSTAHEKKGE